MGKSQFFWFCQHTNDSAEETSRRAHLCTMPKPSSQGWTVTRVDYRQQNESRRKIKNMNRHELWMVSDRSLDITHYSLLHEMAYAWYTGNDLLHEHEYIFEPKPFQSTDMLMPAVGTKIQLLSTSWLSSFHGGNAILLWGTSSSTPCSYIVQYRVV